MGVMLRKETMDELVENSSNIDELKGLLDLETDRSWGYCQDYAYAFCEFSRLHNLNNFFVIAANPVKYGDTVGNHVVPVVNGMVYDSLGEKAGLFNGPVSVSEWKVIVNEFAEGKVDYDEFSCGVYKL